MILHVPHSSQETLGYKINNRDRELLRMTDHFTNDLYSCQDAVRVEFGVSRLICDVERFEEDEQESMSRFGMGVCYEKDTEGNPLRVVSAKDKQEIIQKHYRPHHELLRDAVKKELETKDSSLIVDCHSFPDTPYYFNSDYGKKRPDVCIGADEFHTSKELALKVKKFFLKKGYWVEINSPYSGSMVPLDYYRKNKNVESIMIELNRKLYVDEEGFKIENYDELKRDVSELLNILESF